MFGTQTVRIEIDDDPESGLERNRSLEFPRALVEQADWFDGLMTRLAAEIEAGGDPALALYDADISESGPEREMLDRTAETLQQLHAEGRDHIWAYYTRNLVRPLALAKDQVDVIVGNPPWLTYNRADAIVRAELETQSKARYQIWAGGRYATHQDIAGLFFVRCIDLYLKQGGAAAMVLPHSALQTGQYTEVAQRRLGRCHWGTSRCIGRGTSNGSSPTHSFRFRRAWCSRGSWALISERSGSRIARAAGAGLRVDRLSGSRSRWWIRRGPLRRRTGSGRVRGRRSCRAPSSS